MPINTIKPIIESFRNTGKFEEAYLGIFAYDKGIMHVEKNAVELDSGIYIAQISKEGPSSLSALKIGDIITKIDNINVNKMCTLRRYIYTKVPGDEVNLTILRNKKEYNVKIKLGRKN